MPARARFDLVAFDLDGVLIDHREPIWKTLHERLGSDPEVRRALVREGLAGRLPYAEWFAGDVALLRAAGATRAALEAVAGALRATPGGPALVADLRAGGARVVVISGGVDVVMDAVLPGVAFDEVHINRLHFDGDGALVGGEPTAYDLHHKATGLREIAARHGVPLHRTAFVGDGHNDVAIAALAGFSVAWTGSPPELVRASRVAVDARDLRALRPLLFEGP